MEKQSRGRPRKFTPESFAKAWEDYFQWCDDNPWYKNEAIKSGEKAGQIVKVPTVRPYTESGFCTFHRLGEKYLRELSNSLEGKQDRRSKQFSAVLSRARAKCYAQKFEGAVVGVFSASIIARELGLADKKDVTTKGENINRILTPKEAREFLEQLEKEI